MTVLKVALLGAVFLVALNASAILPNPQVPTTTHGVATYANTSTMLDSFRQQQMLDVSKYPNPNFVLDNTGQGIETVIQAFVVRDDYGMETIVPILSETDIAADDVVEYHAYFVNRSGERIRSMMALLEIPEGAELVGGVYPPASHATVDGVRFGQIPLRTNSNGQLVDIALKYYKALRWDIQDVGIDGMAMVKYRAKLNKSSL